MDSSVPGSPFPVPGSVPGSWLLPRQQLSLTRPFVVGILNMTPDSFSDGGLFESVESAVDRTGQMVAEGADCIDIGGESTRPQGARLVAAPEEIRRVVPVVSAVRARFADLPISVDTTKSEVAAAALDAGADIINDVSGFRLDPRMSEIVAGSGAGAILMHSRGGVAEMATYRFAEYSADVVGDVIAELEGAVARVLEAGVARESIVLDPGIGFAKRSEHSLRVLAELARFVALGYPIMVGVSRKRFIGELSKVERAADRVAGTVGANVAALMRGAQLFRVHDVAPNRQALDVAWGILQSVAVDRQPVPTGLEESLGSHPPAFGGHPPVPGSQPPRGR